MLRERILKKLGEKFNPIEISVLDESAQHAGHYAMQNNVAGETHFSVFMISKMFDGKSKLERHRLVNNTLDEEFDKFGLHALKLSLKSTIDI